MQEFQSDDFILFCLAYAGASAQSVYGQWKSLLPKHIKIVPLELAGHGSRMLESCQTSMQDVIEGLWSKAEPYVFQSKYGFFGHSLGAVVAYELSIAIKRRGGLPSPVSFVSASRPPHIGYSNLQLSQQPKDILIKRIIGEGGIDTQILNRDAVINLFLPILRADYALAENYQCAVPTEAMAEQLVCFTGTDDTLVQDIHVQHWANYAKYEFTKKLLPGSHIFVNTQAQEICKNIYETVDALLTCTL